MCFGQDVTHSDSKVCPLFLSVFGPTLDKLMSWFVGRSHLHLLNWG